MGWSETSSGDSMTNEVEVCAVSRRSGLRAVVLAVAVVMLFALSRPALAGATYSVTTSGGFLSCGICCLPSVPEMPPSTPVEITQDLECHTEDICSCTLQGAKADIGQLFVRTNVSRKNSCVPLTGIASFGVSDLVFKGPTGKNCVGVSLPVSVFVPRLEVEGVGLRWLSGTLGPKDLAFTPPLPVSAAIPFLQRSSDKVAISLSQHGQVWQSEDLGFSVVFSVKAEANPGSATSEGELHLGGASCNGDVFQFFSCDSQGIPTNTPATGFTANSLSGSIVNNKLGRSCT